MDHNEEIVPPPYVLEDAAAPVRSVLDLRISDFDLEIATDTSNVFDYCDEQSGIITNADASPQLLYSHGLHLGRAPQLRSGLFVGRDAELEQLQQLLLPGSSTRNVVAIAAVGGLGKTQLAIKFAELFHTRYSSVFWLNAKDESVLKQEFTELIEIVSEQAQNATLTALDERQAIQKVKHWLSLPNNNRWLLVLDNYDDPNLPGLKSSTGYDIRTFFPQRNQGSILITTRSQKLSFAERLKLTKFEDVAQSLKILSSRSGKLLANGRSLGN